MNPPEEYMAVVSFGLFAIGRKLLVNPQMKCGECNGIGWRKVQFDPGV